MSAENVNHCGGDIEFVIHRETFCHRNTCPNATINHPIGWSVTGNFTA